MLTVKDKISADVLGAVNGVKQSAGYQNDLTAKPVDVLADVPDDSKAVIYEGDPREEDESTLGHKGWYQPYTVRAWSLEPAAGDPIEEVLGTIGADVAKAIIIDPHRNGLAHNTYIRQVKSYPQSTPPAVDVLIEVHYRTLLRDPYSQ